MHGVIAEQVPKPILQSVGQTNTFLPPRLLACCDLATGPRGGSWPFQGQIDFYKY